MKALPPGSNGAPLPNQPRSKLVADGDSTVFGFMGFVTAGLSPRLNMNHSSPKADSSPSSTSTTRASIAICGMLVSTLVINSVTASIAGGSPVSTNGSEPAIAPHASGDFAVAFGSTCNPAPTEAVTAFHCGISFSMAIICAGMPFSIHMMRVFCPLGSAMSGHSQRCSMWAVTAPSGEPPRMTGSLKTKGEVGSSVVHAANAATLAASTDMRRSVHRPSSIATQSPLITSSVISANSPVSTLTAPLSAMRS